MYLTKAPSRDGNGRVIRAFTNWLFRLKGLPPIYIDEDNKENYKSALHMIDDYNNYKDLQIIFIKAMISTVAELHENIII